MLLNLYPVRKSVIRDASILLSAVLLSLAAYAFNTQNTDLRSRAQTTACYTWPISDTSNDRTADGLQFAVNNSPCVTVRSGTWELNHPITIPSNRTITGQGRDSTTLKAVNGSEAWPRNDMEAVLQTVNMDIRGVKISGLTVDANSLSTHGVCCRGIEVTNTRIRNAKCTGVTIVGMEMVVRNNIIEKNGFSCPVAPPGAGIYTEVYPEGVPSSWAPLIEGNTITGNGGPGLDINKVWRGTFRNNTVNNNAHWAALSLYGASFWTITGNTVNQPSSSLVQPYHPRCAGGPDGNHSAGLIVCHDTDENNSISNDNTIDNNKISGWYGILLIGNDEAKPYMAPRFNIITNNTVTGSKRGCADDMKPTQWSEGKNTWQNNNCTGAANSAPTFF